MKWRARRESENSGEVEKWKKKGEEQKKKPNLDDAFNKQ